MSDSWTPPVAASSSPTPERSPYPPPAAARRPPYPAGWPRPVFREPYPVRGGAVALGMVGGGLWMMLFGLLATSARGYAWISIIAGLIAWGIALVLARLGDRGAAVGVAMSVAVGVSIAAIVIGVRWAHGTWLLW